MNPALLLLLAAIMRVESGGDLDAVGARGELGCLQIRPVLVEDLNRIAGRKRFTLEDRRVHAKSVEMFVSYLEHYATPERLGRDPTPEDFARIWNGGPNGFRRASTLTYWQKVRTQLLNARR